MATKLLEEYKWSIMPHLTKRSIFSFKLKYPIFPCYKSFTIFSPVRRVEKFFAIRKGMEKGEKENQLVLQTQGWTNPFLLARPLSHPRTGNSICQPPPLSYLIVRKYKTRFLHFSKSSGGWTETIPPWKWIHTLLEDKGLDFSRGWSGG